MKKSFSQIVREAEADLQRRLQAKVPDWAEVPGLRLPARLNVEQCSSAATARYKASVAARILDGIPAQTRRIADLTGGLGVDSWALSEVAGSLLYNEMDAALCETVRDNFAVLGLHHVCFRNGELRPGTVREILGDFQPDLIYLDPARRSAGGRKVFLLEDCSPDLNALQEELLSCAPHLLVKLSPMADISLLQRQLKGLTAVHIVASAGECKELLLQMGQSETDDITLTVTELQKEGTSRLGFSGSDRAIRCQGLEIETKLEGNWLFEPGAALSKSGCQDAACQRVGLRKLAPSTHLYLAADGPVPELAPFGRFRRILEVAALDKRLMKEIGKRYPQADVSARNIPLRSEELARRMGVRSGGIHHIYGAAVLTSSQQNYLIITEI